MCPSRSTVAARRFVPPRSTAQTRQFVDFRATTLECDGLASLVIYRFLKPIQSALKPAPSRLRLASAIHIETNCRDQHPALDDVLRPVLDVEQRHAIVKAGEDQSTEHGAENRAAPAHQTGAADHA